VCVCVCVCVCRREMRRFASPRHGCKAARFTRHASAVLFASDHVVGASGKPFAVHLHALHVNRIVTTFDGHTAP
jgi:hypothetical protein